MSKENTLTVYYDGLCPLCTTEVKYYERCDREKMLRFVDVAQPTANLPTTLDRASALSRFHVQTDSGRIYSGAEAFFKVWQRLPGWKTVANAERIPGFVRIMELSYKVFLLVRPLLSRLFRMLLKLRILFTTHPRD